MWVWVWWWRGVCVLMECGGLCGDGVGLCVDGVKHAITPAALSCKCGGMDVCVFTFVHNSLRGCWNQNGRHAEEGVGIRGRAGRHTEEGTGIRGRSAR